MLENIIKIMQNKGSDGQSYNHRIVSKQLKAGLVVPVIIFGKMLREKTCIR